MLWPRTTHDELLGQYIMPVSLTQYSSPKRNTFRRYFGKAIGLRFKDELQIISIVKDRPLSVPTLPSLSVCEWEQSELVIKSDEEWSRFRDSCFFSFFSSITGTPLPDIDFSSQMVLVSMQDMKGLGTQIEAVLEFSSDVVVVISDDVSSIPPPAPGFPFNVVSVIRKDLPVNFIRVKNLISP
jgi:hypothetical protein